MKGNSGCSTHTVKFSRAERPSRALLLHNMSANCPQKAKSPRICAQWHPVDFRKSSSTPNNVVMYDNQSTTLLYIIVPYTSPQRPMVIYCLSWLWPHRVKYRNVHDEIWNWVKSIETVVMVCPSNTQVV